MMGQIAAAVCLRDRSFQKETLVPKVVAGPVKVRAVRKGLRRQVAKRRARLLEVKGGLVAAARVRARRPEAAKQRAAPANPSSLRPVTLVPKVVAVPVKAARVAKVRNREGAAWRPPVKGQDP